MRTLPSIETRNERRATYRRASSVAKLAAQCILWLAAGAALVAVPMEAQAAGKAKHGRMPTEWEIVYRTSVPSTTDAKRLCPVIIGTNGKEWPRPITDYTAMGLDEHCDPSGLAIHDNVTRNNAGPDQR